MADSLPLGTDVDAVPSPIEHLTTGRKGGQKSSFSDDVKLKLAHDISSQLDIRHILLIPEKINKTHVIEELLAVTNEYLNPITVNKATLNKWLADCMALHEVNDPSIKELCVDAAVDGLVIYFIHFNCHLEARFEWFWGF